jgi:hypothetical protein
VRGLSAQDAVAATREALTQLTATVLQIRNEYGDTLGVRRLTSDVARLSEALDQLGEPQPGHHPPTRVEEMIVIPDDAYDESMWRDAQSETHLGQ